VKTSALPYPNDDIERRLRAGCRVERRLSELTKAYQELTTKIGRNLTAAMQAMVAVKSPAEFIELQQRLIKEGVETFVGDSQRISQLTTAVFTAAFEPVKKRVEAVQNSAHP
jgi:phasin family protein